MFPEHFQLDIDDLRNVLFAQALEDNDVVDTIQKLRLEVRSHDTHYRYRQNSDFFYLTGFEEPDAIAIVAPSKEKKFTLFVRPRDREREMWEGYRAGVDGAVSDYSADEAFPLSEFGEKLVEILDGPNKRWCVPVLLPPEFTKSDVPIGTEIWLENV